MNVPFCLSPDYPEGGEYTKIVVDLTAGVPGDFAFELCERCPLHVP